jgi:hypothetical protein
MSFIYKLKQIFDIYNILKNIHQTAIKTSL